MPKAPRIPRSSGSPNKCNYCKNHIPEPVFSKNHRDCPFKTNEHYERYASCLKTRGNTTRMQEYRRNKAGNGILKLF